MRREEKAPVEPDLRTSLQWGLGCLVGGAALGGTVILVFLVAIAVQPPVWVQIVIGLVLVAGSIVLAWLYTSALRRSEESSSRGRVSLRSEPPERGRPSNG